MANLYNAALNGRDAEVRQLIDRGGDVHYKDVRRRLPRARRAPASSPRARSSAASSPRARSSAEGTSRLGPEEPK